MDMDQWLVGGLEHFLFSHILGIIIPTDFHIFQRCRYTTNQMMNVDINRYKPSIDGPFSIAMLFYPDGYGSMMINVCFDPKKWCVQLEKWTQLDT